MGDSKAFTVVSKIPRQFLPISYTKAWTPAPFLSVLCPIGAGSWNCLPPVPSLFLYRLPWGEVCYLAISESVSTLNVSTHCFSNS